MTLKLNGHRNIYDVVKKEKLDVVNQPISKAHGLPNECYNSKEYTNIERKKIFEDKWVVVGVASSIPKSGDAKPFDLLGIPLILLRTKNNKIFTVIVNYLFFCPITSMYRVQCLLNSKNSIEIKTFYIRQWS